MPSSSQSPDPFGEFDFDLARAVLEQLVEAFNARPVGKLDSAVLLHMKKRQGVYHLYLDGQLVYVGKANNLPNRLARHYKALSARQNLDPDKLGFKALYIHKNWTTWTTENAMIQHFSPLTPNLWNTSGFGSNDPGHNREDTREDDTFNNQYPINLDIPCMCAASGTYKAFDLLCKIKESLPYLLRFQRGSRRPADQAAEAQLRNTDVKLERDEMSVRDVMVEITKQLGSGWQSTGFKGRVILYKEHVDYNYGTILYRAE